MKNKQHNPVDLDITIQVDATAIQKLWLWTDLAQGEVSALGIVDEIKDKDTRKVEILRVTDFHLVNQICNDVETELDPEAIGQLMQEVDDPARLRCWAHSHGTMGAFWSGTDDETISGLANGEWLLSLVVNKKREVMMRLDQFHPVHLYLEDVAFEVFYPATKGLEDQCRKEFKAKVTEAFPLIKITTERLHSQVQVPSIGMLPEDDWWEGVEPDDLEEVNHG